MSSFHDRYAAAEQWELDLIDKLRECGWLAERFGQAQIPQEIRDYLPAWRDTYNRPTLLRWTPDIIAVHPGRADLCLIDAKTERSDTPNYSVEVHAVETGLSIVRDWNTPVYYVWSDGGVMTPEIVLNRHSRRLDGKGANGSGTAFYLVDKAFRLSASEMFAGVKEQAS